MNADRNTKMAKTKKSKKSSKKKASSVCGLTPAPKPLQKENMSIFDLFEKHIVESSLETTNRQAVATKPSAPSVPNRELILQQQIADIRKMFADDPQLAADISKQIQDRKEKTGSHRLMPQIVKQSRKPLNLDKGIQDYSQGEPISDEELNKLSSRFGKGSNTSESKIVLTKGQLKEVVSKAIELKSKKNIVKEAMVSQIREQIKVAKLTESLLTEGPLSNMFAGISGAAKGGAGAIKGAGQQIGQAVAGVGQAAKAKAMQAVDQSRQADAAKEAKTNLVNFFKNTSKTKEKFSQEKLKNATLINQYHDSVVALNNALEQAQSFLSQPEAQKFSEEVKNIVNNLYYDLTSEKEGIDVFLKTLKNSIPQLSGKVGAANAVKSAKAAAMTGPDGRGEIKGGFGRPSERGTRRF